MSKPKKTKSLFDQLPPKAQEQWRANASKGGKAGSHEDKVRAGQLGWQARLAKMKAQA